VQEYEDEFWSDRSELKKRVDNFKFYSLIFPVDRLKDVVVAGDGFG
jgi:hypothetical protein